MVRDHAALSGSEVVDPKASTSPNTGIPDVEFSFTAAGRRAFREVTAGVARRGALVSSLGQTLNQHFAVALDNKLITVPSIDFKQYPDGIDGTNGADITGGFTIQSAQDLATQLRLGALPIKLKLISEAQGEAKSQKPKRG